ncbi:MAG: hypothetical protein KC636_21435, partial [Myxococcales bacterium]|nr:hypothetical protein [Myxococcales bacterium]
MKTSARALPALLALTLAPACGDDLDARESDGVSTALASSTGSDATTGASDDGSSGSDGSGTTTDDSSTTTDATIDPDPSTTTDATITDTDDDTTGEPAPVCGPWPEELPQPWVGADCAHDVDCGYEGGFCLLEEEGFPCGTCSHPCDQYCDDLDGAPETFCVDAEDLALGPQGGLCVSQCDPGLLGGDGCRAGYDCVALPRFGEPDVAKGVCVPEALAPEKSGCYAELEALGVAFAPTDWPVEHPDDHPELDCVIEDPVWLYSPVGGVPFRYHNSAESSPVLVSCELAKSIHQMATLMK